VVEASVPNIFDPPPIDPGTPDRDERGAIGGFLASINFGRARRGRAKAAGHVVTHGAILLAVGHLLAAYGASLNRADVHAPAHTNNWYHRSAESRAVMCRAAVGCVTGSSQIG